MDYDFPLWKPSRHYVWPPDAGPAWREAYEAGCDLAELEENLKLTPAQRLDKHARMIADYMKREQFLEMLQAGRDFISKIEHRSINRQS
jgi:hypothetical protein